MRRRAPAALSGFHKQFDVTFRFLLLVSLVWLIAGPAPVLSQSVPQNFHVLYTFTGGTDGAWPYSGLLLKSGYLYGTALAGGTRPPADYCCGTVFKISKTGVQTVLYAFSGNDADCGSPDGARPAGDLVSDSAGNLYGTTTGGGICHGPPGNGVVFKVNSKGKETVLHAFNGDGTTPLGLIRDASVTLYGVTPFSDQGNGMVYSVDKTGAETVLYSFSGPEGGGPYGDLIRDANGHLYGTAAYGGSGDKGVVFKVPRANKEIVVHSFAGAPSDGSHPYAGLLPDGAGNMYGTSFDGGADDGGTVYKLDKTGQVTIIYSFTGGADGGHPYGGLIRDSSGNLYGTTTYGGKGTCTDGTHKGCGVVFRLDANGQETVLHRFSGGADGASPYFGKLTLDPKGNLYGTTAYGGAGYGVVFAITH
jgi:uncharacterized repeat protein (TIGR03803 family)